MLLVFAALGGAGGNASRIFLKALLMFERRIRNEKTISDSVVVDVRFLSVCG